RDHSPLRRSREAEEEAVKEVLRHLARAFEGRSEVRLSEGMRAAHSRHGPDGQCASIAGSGGLFCENALQSIIAAYPRSDPGVQQVKCKEDWAFSRDLLKRVGGQGARAFAHLYVGVHLHVGFRAKSGHSESMCQCPLMTHSGLRQTHCAVRLGNSG